MEESTKIEISAQERFTTSRWLHGDRVVSRYQFQMLDKYQTAFDIRLQRRELQDTMQER